MRTITVGAPVFIAPPDGSPPPPVAARLRALAKAAEALAARHPDLAASAGEIAECARIAAGRPDLVLQPEALRYWGMELGALRRRAEGEGR